MVEAMRFSFLVSVNTGQKGTNLASSWNINPKEMTAVRIKYDGIYGKIMSSSCLNKFCSEFTPVIIFKFPFFPRSNLMLYKPYVTLRKGPLMHNTTMYTGHVQNIYTWVIVEYHNKLWEFLIKLYIS